MIFWQRKNGRAEISCYQGSGLGWELTGKREREIWGLEIVSQLTLELHRFELRGSTYLWIIFDIYIVGPLHYWISRLQSQSTEDKNFYPWLIQSMMWNPCICIWRANCLHCTTPFYIRDLNIHGFWCMRRFLGLILHRYWKIAVVSVGCRNKRITNWTV